MSGDDRETAGVDGYGNAVMFAVVVFARSADIAAAGDEVLAEAHGVGIFRKSEIAAYAHHAEGGSMK